jgi:putative membrane protein
MHMDEVYLDALLAYLHYFAIFAVFVTLSLELVLCKGAIDNATVRRLGHYDAAFAVSAMLALATGFLRAVYGVKGWGWYAENPFFWVKVGTFAVIGLISIVPTIAFLRWKKQNVAPTAEQTARVRKYIAWETFLLPILPLCAVLMARAIGSGVIVPI